MAQQVVVDSALVELVARRVFRRAGRVLVEPASPGRVQVVYRVRADERVCYLRVAEEAGADLSTDAQVLGRLARLGVRVPAVLHVEAVPADLDRSFMIVTEIRGQSLAQQGTADQGTADQARQAARAAGRDAAQINALTVDGFGWLRRDDQPGLRAELARYADFATRDLPGRWPGWLAPAFGAAQLDALQAIVERERRVPASQGHLAHGDLDLSHIFIDHGQYAGLIDFGEMRGADRYFDLGHFLLHDGEQRAPSLFEPFLAGYAEVAPLAEDHRVQIRRSAILSGLRQLSLWLGPERNGSATDPPAQRRVARLLSLLEGE